MKLSKVSYSEFQDEDREWVLESATFKNINLIVGKNGSGKTRLLNVIGGLAELLSGRRRQLYPSGEYKVEFQSDKSQFKYEFRMLDYKVTFESLFEDDKLLLNRDSSGKGKVWAEEEGKEIKFQVPDKELVAVTRLDKVQHSFFDELNRWAKSAKHYKFGEQLGKDRVYTMAGSDEEENNRLNEFTIDPVKVTAIYHTAFEAYQDKFDKAIIKDMNDIGYPCSDVGLSTTPDMNVQGVPAAVLFVKENDLRAPTTQLHMSQGMFRAFSLLIQINYSIFSTKHTTIFIDDIGEGLDFDRSSKLIDKIICFAEKHNFDLTMTTNDRYVMNKVDLKYWSVIHRVGSKVRLINKMNSKEVFENFEFAGLSNFNFFSSEFYLGEKND